MIDREHCDAFSRVVTRRVRSGVTAGVQGGLERESDTTLLSNPVDAYASTPPSRRDIIICYNTIYKAICFLYMRYMPSPWAVPWLS